MGYSRIRQWEYLAEELASLKQPTHFQEPVAFRINVLFLECRKLNGPYLKRIIDCDTSERIKVEANTYSNDLKQALVYCPVCGMQHTLGSYYVIETDDDFRKEDWYGFFCLNCSQTIAFMLEFPKVIMEAGQLYEVMKPAHSFGVIDGVLVNFKEKVTRIEVLPKPQTVIVFDGESETLEPLPTHLAEDDWYRARDLSTGKQFWLNSRGLLIKLIDSIERAAS